MTLLQAATIDPEKPIYRMWIALMLVLTLYSIAHASYEVRMTARVPMPSCPEL